MVITINGTETTGTHNCTCITHNKVITYGGKATHGAWSRHEPQVCGKAKVHFPLEFQTGEQREDPLRWNPEWAPL